MRRRMSTYRRKMPKQARSKVTVDVLLRATAQVLKRVGFAKTTTNRVAEAAGVSIGTVYQYFPSKEALVAAVIDRHQDEISTIVKKKWHEVNAESVPEATAKMVEVAILAHGIDPELHRVLEEQVPRVGRLKRLEQMQDEWLQTLRHVYRSRRGELRVRDTDLAALVVVHVVEALSHAVVRSHPEYLRGNRMARELTELLVRYLAPPPAASGTRRARVG